MKLYDVIEVQCWHCSAPIELHSTSGRCEMRTFQGNAVPLVVARGVEGWTGKCMRCDAYYVVHVDTPVAKVSLVRDFTQPLPEYGVLPVFNEEVALGDLGDSGMALVLRRSEITMMQLQQGADAEVTVTHTIGYSKRDGLTGFPVDADVGMRFLVSASGLCSFVAMENREAWVPCQFAKHDDDQDNWRLRQLILKYRAELLLQEAVRQGKETRGVQKR